MRNETTQNSDIVLLILNDSNDKVNSDTEFGSNNGFGF